MLYTVRVEMNILKKGKKMSFNIVKAVLSIVLASVFMLVGCGEDSKKIRSKRNKDRKEKITITKLDTKLKKFDCRISDTIANIDSSTEIKCTNEDNLSKDDLADLKKVLRDLKKRAGELSNDVDKSRELRSNYDMLAELTEDKIKDIDKLLKKKDKTITENYDDGVTKIDEWVDEYKDQIMSSTDDCYYEDSGNKIVCDPSLEDIIEMYTPEEAAALALKVDLRISSFETFIKNIEDGLVKKAENEFEESDNLDEDDAEELVKKAERARDDILPSSTKEKIEKDIDHMKVFVGSLSIRDIQMIILEINLDISTVDSILDFEIPEIADEDTPSDLVKGSATELKKQQSTISTEFDFKIDLDDISDSINDLATKAEAEKVLEQLTEYLLKVQDFQLRFESLTTADTKLNNPPKTRTAISIANKIETQLKMVENKLKKKIESFK